MKILEYRGHIRNWAALCEELGVDFLLPAKEREEAILLAAYRTKCGPCMPCRIESEVLELVPFNPLSQSLINSNREI